MDADTFTVRSSDSTKNAVAMGNWKNWDMDAVKQIAGRGLVVQMNESGSTDYTMHDAKDPLYQGHAPAPKPNKFRNKIVEIDGIKFRSKLEGNRYLQLKLMKASGFVQDFKMQVEFRLEHNGILITRYRADFVVTYADGTEVVEDTKGVETEAFVIKKNLMLALLGIEIQLIKSNINGNNNKVKSKKGGRRRGR